MTAFARYSADAQANAGRIRERAEALRDRVDRLIDESAERIMRCPARSDADSPAGDDVRL